MPKGAVDWRADAAVCKVRAGGKVSGDGILAVRWTVLLRGLMSFGVLVSGKTSGGCAAEGCGCEISGGTGWFVWGVTEAGWDAPVVGAARLGAGCL